MTIPDDFCPVAREGLGERVVEGEMLLVNAEGGEILVLNECGVLIWQLLDGVNDMATLVGRVTEAFDVDEPTARSDVEEFLASLATRGILDGELPG